VAQTQRDVEEVAVGLLARREHGRAELARKLAQRGFTAQEIDTALDQLEARDWLSNRRYAESLLRSRLAKRHGPLKIRAELRQNGVPEQIVAEVIDEQSPDWLELAREQLAKRFGDEPAGDQRERARRFRHLQARGFPSDIARAALMD